MSYVFYIVYYIKLKIKNKVKLNTSILEKIIFVYILITTVGISNEIIKMHNNIEFFRLILIYIVPVVFFYLLIKLKQLKVEWIIFLLIFSSFLIGLELLDEFLTIDGATTYQVLNFEYVKNKVGRSLFQLLGGLRSAGLIEHNHATGFVIAFGFLASYIIYILKSQIFMLGVSIFLFLVLISVGARIAVLTSLLFIIFFNILNKKHIKRQILFILVAIVTFMIYFSSTYVNDKKYRYFWNAIYIQHLPYLKTIDVLNKKEYSEYGLNSNNVKLNNSASNIKIIFSSGFSNFKDNLENMNLKDLLFGVGFGKYAIKSKIMNDDLFFLQLFFQIGILGSMLLFTILLFTHYYIYKLIKYDNNYIAWISYAFFILLLLSFLHSGVFVKKQIYPFFFLFLFIVDYEYQQYFKKFKKLS